MTTIYNTSRAERSIASGGVGTALSAVTIPPGGSAEIDSEALKEAKNNPVVKEWFDSGILTQNAKSVRNAEDERSEVEALRAQLAERDAELEEMRTNAADAPKGSTGDKVGTGAQSTSGAAQTKSGVPNAQTKQG